MKSSLLLLGLVAGLTLAKHSKKKSTIQTKPTIPDVEAFKHLPGMNDLFAQAMQDGKSEQQLEEDIKKVANSPGMVNMMAELQKKKDNGASLDDLVDTAFDSVLGKRKMQDEPARPVEDLCVEYCVVLKMRQCMAFENTLVSVKECGKDRVESDCKKNCTLQ
jgi:hypothetical protein